MGTYTSVCAYTREARGLQFFILLYKTILSLSLELADQRDGTSKSQECSYFCLPSIGTTGVHQSIPAFYSGITGPKSAFMLVLQPFTNHFG